MPHRFRPLRLFGLLLAALQLVLPGAAMVAEAKLSAETERVTHIEGYAARCEFRHHPAQCAVCQFLRSPATEGGPAFRVLTAADRRSPRPEMTARRSAPGASFFPLPRSPPSLA